jgi:ABC-2 type transport system permease protein
VNPVLWSFRRELWEHRWLWSVPLLIGVTVIAVFSGVALMQLVSVGAGANAEPLLAARLSAMFDLATRMILVTGTIVAFVYCAEAVHGERRDRAILFWKTWPVGDGTAVAAKAMVPLIVVPAVTLALLIAAQVMAMLVLMGKNIELHAPMTNPIAATLEVIGATLWIAPVYAWIMVVSAWARRAVLLLAFLPMLLVAVVEVMFTGDAVIGHALFFRGVGRHWHGVKLSLDSPYGGVMTWTPAPELLRSPALWLGVVLAVLLLSLVTTLRRRMIALN